jgi:hypothetical protein
MTNPKTILAEWVTALQALPNLVDALGGDGSYIQFYTENATVFGQPTQNNIRLAILSMPPGSIMIAWQGTGPGRLGNALVFVHDFSLYLARAGRSRCRLRGSLQLDRERRAGGQQPPDAAHPVDPNCEPMDFYLPSARRNTVVISPDGATFEYFEVPVRLIESYNP